MQRKAQIQQKCPKIIGKAGQLWKSSTSHRDPNPGNAGGYSHDSEACVTAKNGANSYKVVSNVFINSISKGFSSVRHNDWLPLISLSQMLAV